MKTITCIVDDTVQRRSTFWGEHGLSFHIQTNQGCVLFDTGQTVSVLLHNMALLGSSLANINAVILSHAHYDHTGGLIPVLSHTAGLLLYAHPDLSRPRFALRDDKYTSIGLHLTQAELAQLVDLRLSDAPAEVLPGVWTTGDITERLEPEGRSSRHFVQAGDGWQPDPYRDDMSLVLETREGVVVVCGCCHAGLLNTLAHVHRTFQRPIVAVLGGTHLMDADEAHLQHVVGELRDTYGSSRLYLNHCTGERAYVALVNAFGDRVQPCPAGTTLTFE
jgi:7,8-dihydropterin-6-yl-methyl-4-(beta-D-ribofuranosyl)aminobenzene 5'-phosphate synthase